MSRGEGERAPRGPDGRTPPCSRERCIVAVVLRKRDGKVSGGFCGHLQRGNSRMEKSKTKTVPKGLAGVSKGLTYPLELVSALGMSYLGLAFCSSRALGVYVQWRGPPPQHCRAWTWVWGPRVYGRCLSLTTPPRNSGS